VLDAATWIIDLLLPTEGYCDSVMIHPDVETWIIEFLHHTEGSCDGVVICWLDGFFPVE
jgi:hypothetical protein